MPICSLHLHSSPLKQKLLICVASSSSMPTGGPVTHSPPHPGQIPRGHPRTPPSGPMPITKPAHSAHSSLLNPIHTPRPLSRCPHQLSTSQPSTPPPVQAPNCQNKNWSHSAPSNIPHNAASLNQSPNRSAQSFMSWSPFQLRLSRSFSLTALQN